MSEEKKEIVWFGMKLTPEEKQRIKYLAKSRGVSQKEAVMNAVNEELVEYTVDAKPGSLLEKMQKYMGVINAPEDLSTNPNYMEGFGEGSLS